MKLLIQKNKPLKKFTTLGVGGKAEFYVEIHSEKTLHEAIIFAKENNLPVTVLGEGSNVLISENGVNGLVIIINIKGITDIVTGSDVCVTAQAGEKLDDLVAYSVHRGYWGIENLSHIPGTVGAAPVQNVGAYGVEIKDVIKLVKVYNIDSQQFETFSVSDCVFEYRDSFFKKKEGKKYIVVSVTFLLSTIVSPCLSYKDLQNKFTQTNISLSKIRDEVIETRSKKFPNWQKTGNAGSFFKNPIISTKKFEDLQALYPNLPSFPAEHDFVKIPIGWVLDKVLHIKELDNEKVGAYRGQALVFINKGNATSDDFISFATEIQQQVYNATGIQIEWEVTKIGFEISKNIK